MVSKADIKLIRSLQQKKFREENGLFVIEGKKMVLELLESSKTAEPLSPKIRCKAIYVTKATEGSNVTEGQDTSDIECLAQSLHISCESVSQADMERISAFSTPSPALAIAHIPQPEPIATLSDLKQDKLYLALDGVRDPGNLGTILRIADWFGIEGIFLSPDCVDLYSPKTIQSSMGAILRKSCAICELDKLITNLPTEYPVYGTFLDGTNFYETALTEGGLIVMGSESHGIRPYLRELINKKLYIPPYPQGSIGSESLNVAIATAITCAEFRRRTL